MQLIRSLAAFRPQAPQFDPQLCQDLNICATVPPNLFLNTKIELFSHVLLQNRTRNAS